MPATSFVVSYVCFVVGKIRAAVAAILNPLSNPQLRRPTPRIRIQFLFTGRDRLGCQYFQAIILRESVLNHPVFQRMEADHHEATTPR